MGASVMVRRAPSRFLWLAFVAAGLIGPPPCGAEEGAPGIASLGHRLAVRGDVPALERLLASGSTGGVVQPAVRGYLLAELGRFEEAESEYRRALTASPDEPQVWLGLVDLELRRGDRAAARDALGSLWSARAVPPLKAEAVRRQLALVEEDGAWGSVDWGAALGSIDDPDLAWRLLDSLIAAADQAGAVFQVERAASRMVGVKALGLGQAMVLTTIALEVGDLDRARSTVEELLRGEGKSNASMHALQGEVAFQQGRAEEAARSFAEARSLAPSWSRMRARHARASLAAGAVHDAEQDLRALLDPGIDLPVRDGARADLIRGLIERGQWADAARAYVEGVEGRGPERRALALASFVALVNDPGAALASMRSVAVAGAQGGELDRLRAELATRAGDVPSAIRSLELAHDAFPSDPEILEQLARAERQVGRLDGAIAHYRTWTEREPRRVAALTGLVAALRQAGLSEKALEAGRAPSSERPTDAGAWSLTGTVLGLAGFAREGCDALARAHALDEARPAYAFDLAVCSEDLEGGSQALALLSGLLEKGSGGAPWERRRVLERLRGAYQHRGRGQAFDPYVTSVADRPATPDGAGLLLDVAELHAAAGETSDAVGFLERFVSRAPQDSRWASASLRLAGLEAERGRSERGRQAWRAVIARTDLDARWGGAAALALGESLVEPSRGSSSAALEVWGRCAERHAEHPAGARCRLRRARALSDSGREAEAQADLVLLLSNSWRDVETTRTALDLMGRGGKGSPR